MKTYVKVALFFVLLIAVSAILAALYLFNLKHTDMAKAKPDFVITASALQQEFENNEATASTRYINKIIEVTGTIASVKQGENKNLSISLATGSEISSVICTLPEIPDPSGFKKGDELTIRGECSGFLLDVLLNNCAVIEIQKK